jgi:serine incorporator 1/3
MATKEVLRHSARMAFSVLFSFSLLLAWILRDFAKPLLEKIPWIVKEATGGKMPSDEWFGQQAVYRVSLGNFVSSPSLCPPAPPAGRPAFAVG